MTPPSQNTQATLLLTAPLLAHAKDDQIDLLSPGEFNRLTQLLEEKQKTTGDLIGSLAEEWIALCGQHFGRERIELLLGRGFMLSQAVERWTSRGLWVMGRNDEGYPQRLLARLKDSAPAILYGCGNAKLLDAGGLAVVGSRHVDEELISYTENVGRLAAQSGRNIVSGGAKGIDRAAMTGALMAGGTAVGVLSDSLDRSAVARDNRELILDGKLTLISPYDPEAGFNVGHAMQRNKVIYALSDAALVVNSEFEKGGTWAGAIEQLEKLRFVPVFVRNPEKSNRGNAALLSEGAIAWSNPQTADELDLALAKAKESVAPIIQQETLALAFQEAPQPYGARKKGKI